MDEASRKNPELPFRSGTEFGFSTSSCSTSSREGLCALGIGVSQPGSGFASPRAYFSCNSKWGCGIQEVWGVHPFLTLLRSDTCPKALASCLLAKGVLKLQLEEAEGTLTANTSIDGGLPPLHTHSHVYPQTHTNAHARTHKHIQPQTQT